MAERVTLKDIARKADVHFTTVSRALRNDPRLPAATRERLQKLALEMGYSPDPTMKALCAYRQAKRPHPIRCGMAYLTDIPAGHPLHVFGEYVYDKAKQKASQLGYNLRKFNLSTPNTNLESCMGVWWNTGIKGVLIGPFLNQGLLTDGNWDKWVVVAYGYSVDKPDFNRVAPDLFQDLLTHLNILRQRGYKRIGLLLYDNYGTKVFGLLHGAFLLDQARDPSSRIRVNIIREGTNNADKMKAWIEHARLDVVVAPMENYEIMQKAGFRIPEDIGFSELAWKGYEPENPRECAGMNITDDLVAENAVSYLVSQLQEHAFGLPAHPKCVMVSGEFHNGSSIRQTNCQ